MPASLRSDALLSPQRDTGHHPMDSVAAIPWNGWPRCVEYAVNRVVFVELAYSLIQIFLRKIDEGELVGKTRERLLDCLLPQVSRVVLYYKQRFGFFDRYEYQEELLTLDEGPRRNALGKTRALRRGQVAPLGFPLRPE